MQFNLARLHSFAKLFCPRRSNRWPTSMHRTAFVYILQALIRSTVRCLLALFLWFRVRMKFCSIYIRLPGWTSKAKDPLSRASRDEFSILLLHCNSLRLIAASNYPSRNGLFDFIYGSTKNLIFIYLLLVLIKLCVFDSLFIISTQKLAIAHASLIVRYI